MRILFIILAVTLSNHLQANENSSETKIKKGLVVITGANSGIGKATAIHFSRAGYPLLLIGRRLPQMEELNLPNAICVERDVTNLVSFSEAIKQGKERFEEVADQNVRLINIAPGNVKTEIWDHAVPQEKKETHPAYNREEYENLSADDVAKAILFAYEQPQSVCIREIVLAPTRQIK